MTPRWPAAAFVVALTACSNESPSGRTADARVPSPQQFPHADGGGSGGRAGTAGSAGAAGSSGTDAAPGDPCIGFVPPDAGTGATGGVVGCSGGLLVDIRAYFFSVIGRIEGDLACDWEAVLQSSGIPAGLGPGEQTPANAPFYGLTQQVGTAGNVRGRLFLPTSEPDGLGYYTHPIDLLTSEPFHWTWNDWIGGPPYAPRPCP